MSHVPDSFEVYASHRPSGDKRPSPSTNSDVNTSFGVRSPVSGNMPTLNFVMF